MIAKCFLDFFAGLACANYSLSILVGFLTAIKLPRTYRSEVEEQTQHLTIGHIALVGEIVTALFYELH